MTNVGVQSGKLSGSVILLINSMIINTALAYITITCMTLRLLNSCQNRAILFGIGAALFSASQQLIPFMSNGVQSDQIT